MGGRPSYLFLVFGSVSTYCAGGEKLEVPPFPGFCVAAGPELLDVVKHWSTGVVVAAAFRVVSWVVGLVAAEVCTFIFAVGGQVWDLGPSCSSFL